MILRLRQHGVQVLDARHHADGHLAPLGRRLGTRVQARTEPASGNIKLRLTTRRKNLGV